MMHEYAKTKHNYHPALLISNRTGELAPLSDAPSTSEYDNRNNANKPKIKVRKTLTSCY